MQKQAVLMEPKNTPKTEWVGMPEFKHIQRTKPKRSLTIYFETEEDYQAFAKVLNQKLTDKTKSVWFPYKSHWHHQILRWVDTEP